MYGNWISAYELCGQMDIYLICVCVFGYLVHTFYRISMSTCCRGNRQENNYFYERETRVSKRWVLAKEVGT